jgi:hypothetical protein
MRYFLAVLFILFFVIVGSILLIGRLRSPGGSTVPDTVAAAEYADMDASSVIWMQEGRVVGDNKHYSVRITVNENERIVEVMKGYDGQVVRKKSYDNNQEAYRNFLKALDTLEFGRQKLVKVTDEEGICPTGFRYIYEIKVAGANHLRSWSTSCSVKFGPFDGEASTVRKLFKLQIPDYSKVVSGISF